jgi:hypothetical protein
MTQADENVQRSAKGKLGSLEVKLEGLSDGYRFTVKTDEQEVKNQRRVGGALINLLIQAEKAGWKLPWILRKILKFWKNYQ